jgi:small-conductance mechanosensitive channel
VGVAYGSDVPLIMQTLNDCAAANTLVMRMPEPLVFFRNFGESSLDFELRAWVWNVDNMLRVESDLRQEINRRFQESGIVIAFPQRDVHVYQEDNLANSRLWLSMEQPERLASDDTARQ